MGTEAKYRFGLKILILCALLEVALAKGKGKKVCPPRHYGKKCLATCLCHWPGTSSCDPVSGKCQCKPGFKGPRCNQDIDECENPHLACPGRNLYCRNSLGSYECICRSGYIKSPASGSCFACPVMSYGAGCTKTCDCYANNTVLCDSAVGECMCHAGWEGKRCNESINDCVGDPCQGRTCVDLHMNYMCKCLKGLRFTFGECREYVVDFVTFNNNPGIGELVHVFFLYKVHPLYHNDVKGAPNFFYELKDEQGMDICRANFHFSFNRVKGGEWFIRQFKSPTQYNYYSHYILRFFDPKITTVRAVPHTQEYEEKVLVFDVRHKAVAVKECLPSLNFTGLGDQLLTAVQIKRQQYTRFTVATQSTSNCQETPRVEWSYFYIHFKGLIYQRAAKLCDDVRYIKPLDIVALIEASGEPSISDHQSPEEIVPSNTLPLGMIMVCVKAYVLRDPKFNIMECGYLNVQPTNVIYGRLNPPYALMHWTRDYPLSVEADFRELDQNLPLIYDWYCMKRISKFRKATLSDCQEDILAYGRVKKLKQPYNPGRIYYFKKYQVLQGYMFNLSVTVSLRDDPSVSVTAGMIVYGIQSDEALLLNLTCHAGCRAVEGTRNNIVLEMRMIHLPRQNLHWIYKGYNKFQLLVYKGKKKLTKDKFTYLTGEPDKFSVEGTSQKIYYFLSRALEPGIKYTLVWKGYSYSNRTGVIHYEFTTEAAPVGKGCDIKPKFGKAVFTKFILTCLDYKDTVAGLPLLYRLYQKDRHVGSTKYFWTLIAYSGSGTLTNITLSTLDFVGWQTVELKMDIYNVKGSGIHIPVNVTIETDDQRTILQTIGNTLRQLRQGGQEDVRSVKDIATVISVDSTATVAEKTLVRRILLDGLNRFETGSSESVEHTSNALEKCASKEDEIMPDSLDSGLGAAHRVTKYLGKVHSTNSIATKTVAQSQVHAISRLLHVASNTGKDITMENQTNPSVIHSRRKNIEQSKLATSSFGNIADVLLDTMTGIDQLVHLVSEFVEMGLQWHNVSEDSAFTVNASNVHFYLATMDTGLLPSDVMETEFEVFDSNPYGWTTDKVHGDMPVVKINLVEQNAKRQAALEGKKNKKLRFSKPADIFLDYNSSSTETQEFPTIIEVETKNGVSYVRKSSCIFMSVKMSMDAATVLKIVSPDNLRVKVKARYTNVVSAYDEMADEDMVEMPLNYTESYEGPQGTIYRDKQLLFLPQLTQPQKKAKIRFYRVKVQVKLNQEIDVNMYQPINESQIHSSDDPNNDAFSASVFAHYNISIEVTPYRMSCLHFDEEKEDFISDECLITMFSNLSKMHCRCLVAAAFTGSIIVLPNVISPLDIQLFLEVFQNPLVVSMVIGLWMIGIALLQWGRQRDREDHVKQTPTVLDDNHDDHSYVYLVCVVTGWSARAATTSNVFIYLRGSWFNSDNHFLHDPTRRLFQSGAENWFVLTTQDDLGEIKSVVVWTDFSGAQPSWFMNSVFVQNMQTNESWICLFNSWISTHWGSQQLMVDVPALKDTDYTKKWKLQILNKGANDIRNEHLWIGLIAKTAYNKFTRVRRLATAITMLQSLMILNLMFFGIRDADDPGQFMEVLDQKIHLTSVIIGIETSIIITAIGVGVAWLFNKCPPKPDAKAKDKAQTPQTPQSQQTLQTLQTQQTSQTSTQNTNENKPPEQREPVGTATSRKDPAQVMIREPQLEPPGRFKHRESAISREQLSNREEAAKRSSNSTKSPSVIERSKLRGEGSEVDQEPESVQPTGATTEDDSEDAKKKKEELEPGKTGFMLPWWFIYITWALLVVFNVFLSYYIMLYGLSLGYEKSVDWVLTFFMGFLMNVLVIQPIKVVFMVFLLVLIFKQRHTLKEQAPLAKLNEGLKLVNDKKEYNKKYGFLRREKQIVSAPVQSVQARSILQRLAMESASREMIRDLILYTIFMVSILLVVYGHLNVYQRYLQTTYTQNVLLGIVAPSFEDDEGSSALEEVQSVHGMWAYIKERVVPALIIDSSGALKLGSYLMGPARIRQVRVQPDQSFCDRHPKVIQDVYRRKFCSLPMLYGKEETNSFNGTWKTKSVIPKDLLEDSPYIYRTPQELNTASFIGHHGVYSGGGYVIILSRDDRQSSISAVEKVSQTDWIDQHTRAVFLEFTIYNPDSDMFSNVVVYFEFSTFGGLFPYRSVSTAQLFQYEEDERTWLQASEGFAAMCTLFYTVFEVHAMLKKGLKTYFSNFWNVLEILTLLLCYAAGALYFARFAHFVEVLQIFNRFGHHRFIDFQAVFYLHDHLHVILGIAGALAIFKMLKVTTFNPFLVTFIKSIDIAKPDVAGFTMVTIITLMSFAMSGILVFGVLLSSYKSLLRSLVTLLFFILGEPEFDDLVGANLWAGRIYFIIVMIGTQYIIVNFFIAILKEGLELTRTMEMGQESETVKYMVNTLRTYFGLGPKNIRGTEAL